MLIQKQPGKAAVTGKHSLAWLFTGNYVIKYKNIYFQPSLAQIYIMLGKKKKVN